VSLQEYLYERPVIEQLGDPGRRFARRRYQRFLTHAVLIAGAIHLGAMLTGIAVSAIMKMRREAERTRTVKLVPYREIAAPPSLDAKPAEAPKFAVKAPEFRAPPSGIPIPVPEEAAPLATTIASQKQLPFAGTEGDTGLGDEFLDGVPWGMEGGEGIAIQEEVYPGLNDFVAVEEQPVLVEKPTPPYPELARLAKIEGTVIVRVLVGRDGKVKDTVLGKAVNGILDEAALEAAKHYVFKPAMQNKKPVAVWVAIPFNFKLYN
jgi:protein TonB